jgi:hypothetical protein
MLINILLFKFTLEIRIFLKENDTYKIFRGENLIAVS